MKMICRGKRFCLALVLSALSIVAWAQNTLTPLWTRAGVPNSPSQAAISPDGQQVAVAGLGSVVPIVRVRDGLVEREIRLPEFDRATSVAFSPDGDYLAVGTRTAAIWIIRLPDGQPERAIYPHAGSVIALAFSPDGRYIVSSDGGFAQVTRLADGALVRSLWHSYTRRCFFSPDGARVATVSDTRIQLWSFPEGALLLTIPTATSYNFAPAAAAFSPDGQFIAAHFYPNEIRIWRVDDGSLVRRAVYNARSMQGLVFTSDGGYLISAHENAVILWDAASLTQVARRDIAALHIAASPETGYFVTTNRSFTRLWAVQNLTTVNELTSFVGEIGDIAFSANGAILASVNQEYLRIWDAETGALLGGAWMGDRVGTVAISPADDSLVAVGGVIANIGLYNWRTNQWRDKWSTNRNARQMEFSPDGSLLAIAIGSAAVFHRMATNTRFSVSRPNEVWGVRWVDTQQCLILERTGNLVLWNVAQSRLVRNLLLSGDAYGLTVSTDRRFAVVNLSDRVALVQLPALSLVRVFEGAPSPILDAQITPNGRYLVAGDSGGRILIWRVADGALVLQDASNLGAQSQVSINRVQVSPDGRLIVFTRSDGALRASLVPFPRGDANGDGCVDDADLLLVLFHFGSDNAAADLNADGVVDDADLLLTLFDFGAGCQ